MKFKIVNRKTKEISAWAYDIKTANLAKNDFYNADIKLFGKSEGYFILLNEEEF